MSKDRFSPEERSRIMSLIKSGDTRPEIVLRKALWQRGLRFRLRLSTLPGKPDIVFVRAKVAIFVDGAFWHGKKLTSERFAKLSKYWRDKINATVKRDARNTEDLEKMGYLVLRFLDTQVLKHSVELAIDIKKIVIERITSHNC